MSCGSLKSGVRPVFTEASSWATNSSTPGYLPGEVAHRQPADIDARRRQVELGKCLDDGKRLQDCEFAVEDQTGKAMGLKDLDGRAVDERTTVHGGDDVVVAYKRPMIGSMRSASSS